MIIIQYEKGLSSLSGRVMSIMVNNKATEVDVTHGRRLWIKDHGGWCSVIVQGMSPSAKGIKVIFVDEAGREGKRLLEALYRHPVS